MALDNKEKFKIEKASIRGEHICKNSKEIPPISHD
jgi:hypothetical protein